MENIKTNNAQIKYTKRTESDVKQNAKRNETKRNEHEERQTRKKEATMNKTLKIC